MKSWIEEIFDLNVFLIIGEHRLISNCEQTAFWFRLITFPLQNSIFFIIGILLTAILIWIWIFWNEITSVIALIINLFSYFITVFYYNFLNHLTLIDVNIFYIKFHLFNFYTINFYNLIKKDYSWTREIFSNSIEKLNNL